VPRWGYYRKETAADYRFIHRFPQAGAAELLFRLSETLNWRKFLALKNGNWFERRHGAYCQIASTVRR
jgi:hypothetical protein